MIFLVITMNELGKHYPINYKKWTN